LAQERFEKIREMVDASWHKASSIVAFPIDVLFDEKGKFAGFSMRCIGGHKPVHELYSPSSRRDKFPSASFRFLIRAASNISRAVAAVHATSCVIGDINHGGVLVSDKAMATLIDSDSFQVSSKGKIFRCKVGVPEFTPPELHGKDFSTTLRTTNHDAFGLAVLIFQIMFMGRHPFAGRPLTGHNYPTLEEAMGAFRFAYSRQQKLTNMEPPPGVPTLAAVPSTIADAFEQAFGRSGVSLRPTAARWTNLLNVIEQELAVCKTNVSHHFIRGLATCPWCAMEATFPGIILFGLPTSMPVRFIAVDVKGLSAALQAITDPSHASELSKLLMAPKNLAPSAKALQAREAKWNRIWISASGAAMGAVLVFTATGLWFLLGIGALIAALAAASRTPLDVGSLNSSLRTAQGNWTNINRVWEQVSDNATFLNARQQAANAVNFLSAIPQEEARLIRSLEQRRHEAQLKRFLERYRIAHAAIRLVGPGRKLQLASYGIETAADILPSRIHSLPGFGHAIVGELTAWRKSKEQTFKFNPNEPLDPREVAAAKAKVSQEQAKRLAEARKLIQNADNVARDIRSRRASLRSAGQVAFHALKQAELDVQTASAPALIEARQKRYLLILAFGVVAAIYLINNLSRMPEFSLPRKIELPASFPNQSPPIKPAAPEHKNKGVQTGEKNTQPTKPSSLPIEKAPQRTSAPEFEPVPPPEHTPEISPQGNARESPPLPPPIDIRPVSPSAVEKSGGVSEPFSSPGRTQARDPWSGLRKK
jgi:DNA-binding helix-hairpin-helix protein with protein kinase domain